MCGPAFHGKRISDFNYADLPPLLPSEATVSDLAASSGSLRSPGGHDVRIPLLDEVMAEHRDIPIQIDLKVPSQELVNVVNDLVTRHNRQRLVLWGSFIHSTNSALYAANPDVPLFTSAPRALLLLAAHCAGRLREVHVYESAVILPWRLGEGGSRLDPFGLWRPSFLLPSFFRDLNARGVSVVLYGNINDEATFGACLAAGADALCTDSPSRLMRWLASRQPRGGAPPSGCPGAATLPNGTGGSQQTPSTGVPRSAGAPPDTG